MEQAVFWLGIQCRFKLVALPVKDCAGFLPYNGSLHATTLDAAGFRACCRPDIIGQG
jgi:hypothetical protein